MLMVTMHSARSVLYSIDYCNSIDSMGVQLSYSPVNCKGIGLSDGEVLERMWSYLQRFGRMTKEMSPSHRVDILCHGLLYYASMKKKKLGI